MSKLLFAAGLCLIVLITACSPSAATTTVATAPTGAPTSASGTQEASPLEAVARTGTDRPVWLTMPLINAASGATFTLADFTGKTVYIEFMATWCTNCRIQQGNVKTVRAALDTTDTNYIFISLSVEPKDTTPALAQYAVNFQYPWTFAIIPQPMMVDLVTQFGQSITNPTATPHLVISPEGAISQLETGIHSTDQLTAELTTAAAA